VTTSAHPAGLAIDRLAPAHRPPGRPLVYQRWSHLLFLHWRVAAEVLAPQLPPGLELDTFEGKAYVGLIPFTMSRIRPRWLPPLPGLSLCHEVNLRTYVHAHRRDPGVWFFSLDASHPLATPVGRRLFRLPYYHTAIDLTEEKHDGEFEISYDATRKHPASPRASCALRYRASGEPARAEPGTLEHFLIERYILFAHDGKTLYQGRVHHAPYPVQCANLQSLEENFLAAAGITPAAIAPLVHYAQEVDVEIFPLEVAG
jgi:uncharacterized protein YqjF (DUF2071 family)